MIDQNNIHYIKSSIKNFTNKSDRIKVNMDIIGRDTRLHKLQWIMTRERRELWNSITTDRQYPHYVTAVDYWNTAREKLGNSVVIWIGKLYVRKKYKPGQIQHYQRLQNAVSVAMQMKEGGDIIQNIWMDDVHQEHTFQNYPGELYDQRWEWHNNTQTKDSAIIYEI
jgi:hypothetical protein